MVVAIVTLSSKLVLNLVSFGQFFNIKFTFSLYNNINHPSKLAMGVDFHCFKYKIEPKWEDPICANGGRWAISCLKGKADTLWLHTVCF